MENPNLNNFLTRLEVEPLKMLGLWEHGSKVYGYMDELSDQDYVIVWKNNFPTKKQRIELLEELGATNIESEDRSNKAQDKFVKDNVTYNTVHLTDKDEFFELYKKVSTETPNEDWLYRLGGFVRGHILYDPDNLLIEYKERLKVTGEITSNYKNSRKIALKNNSEWLKNASIREQPIDFIKCLNFLLITLAVIQYLENGQFPIPVKWYEKEAGKFNWTNNNLSKVIQLLKDKLPFKEVVNLLS